MKNRTAVSVVGGESLLGRELRDLIFSERVPVQVRLLGVDESSVTLTEQDGEPAIMTPLDEENLTGSAVAVLAGSAASSRKALSLAATSSPQPVLVDMTYVAEDDPAARLRAPLVEPPGFAAPGGAVHVIAHPAAVALALFAQRLTSAQRIRRWTAEIFEPASERGQRGLDELRKQTVGLLSFQSLPKEVFDAQVGFNMLARYGDDAPEALESIELRIERHLASLLGACPTAPMPSIRLVQAPVFHGYSISVHAEFEEKPDTLRLAEALSSPEVDVRIGDIEPPNNVGIAGQNGIAVGSILPDRNDSNACWFWIVADNYRLMAENALAVVRSLLS
ncbi:MAG: Asd/ArgC dimerization domain-containing protein [Bryobacteraceae bacterium]